MGNANASAAPPPATMRRWVLCGVDPDPARASLRLEEVAVPSPRAGQVLIKVCAAPVNPSDYAVWQRSRPVSSGFVLCECWVLLALFVCSVVAFTAARVSFFEVRDEIIQKKRGGGGGGGHIVCL